MDAFGTAAAGASGEAAGASGAAEASGAAGASGATAGVSGSADTSGAAAAGASVVALGTSGAAADASESAAGASKSAAGASESAAGASGSAAGVSGLAADASGVAAGTSAEDGSSASLTTTGPLTASSRTGSRATPGSPVSLDGCSLGCTAGTSWLLSADTSAAAVEVTSPCDGSAAGVADGATVCSKLDRTVADSSWNAGTAPMAAGLSVASALFTGDTVLTRGCKTADVNTRNAKRTR